MALKDTFAEPRLIPELIVSSFSESLAFYQKVLMFDVLYSRPEEMFAMLSKEGAQIMIEEKAKNARFTNGYPSHPYGQGINFQIEVNDVDTLHDHIVANNVDIFYPMNEEWYRTGDVEGGLRQFLVTDPDGYLFRFFTHLGDRPLK